VILALLGFVVYHFISSPAGSSQAIDKIKQMVSLPVGNEDTNKSTNTTNEAQTKVNNAFREVILSSFSRA